MTTTRRALFSLILAGVLLRDVDAGAGSAIKNGSVHNGTEVDVDIPRMMRQQNSGSRIPPFLGLCVWASLQMLANYHNCTPLRDIFEKRRNKPGGGWPEELRREMDARGLQDKYRQLIGTDFDFIKEALAEGRPVACTYGFGEDYRGTISHWVVLVAWKNGKVAVLDDNYINYLSWMDEDEFKRRALHPKGSMWCAYLLWPLPPSPPRN